MQPWIHVGSSPIFCCCFELRMSRLKCFSLIVSICINLNELRRVILTWICVFWQLCIACIFGFCQNKCKAICMLSVFSYLLLPHSTWWVSKVSWFDWKSFLFLLIKYKNWNQTIQKIIEPMSSGGIKPFFMVTKLQPNTCLCSPLSV